jgi:hypothetical protein
MNDFVFKQEFKFFKKWLNVGKITYVDRAFLAIYPEC